MIKRALMLSLAPIKIGQQIHTNHPDCPAGEDRKQRLYIKRVAGGILAYCHHCSDHGFVRDDSVDGARLTRWLKGEEIDVPDTSETEETFSSYEPLSIQAKAWLLKYRCALEDEEHFLGVVRRPFKCKLMLHNPDMSRIGYQIRNLEPKARPKYITHYFASRTAFRGDASWFLGKAMNKKTLVLTEDYLSGYRVTRDTGCTSCALLKTSVSDKTLMQISVFEPDDILIWLDPDEAGRKGAEEAYEKLHFFLPKTIKIAILGMDKEPKEMTPEGLSKALL